MLEKDSTRIKLGTAGTVKLSRWRHWLNFIKSNAAAPRAAKSAQQCSRLNWQLHQLWKSCCLGRAFEVRWTCTCCHDRAIFNCYSFCHFSHFSFFLCFIGGVENTNIAEQVLSVEYCLSPATSGIDNAFDPATHWLPKWIVALHNPERSLNSRELSTPASSNILMTPRRSSSLSPRQTAAIPSTSIFEERTTTEGKWKKRKTRTRMRVVLSWLTVANSPWFLSCTWF